MRGNECLLNSGLTIRGEFVTLISKFTTCITTRLVEKEIIRNEDFDIYLFGLETFVMKAYHLSTYFVVAIIFGRIPELTLFLLTFIPLREYGGGYHAKTSIRCYIISCLTVLSFLWLLIIIPKDMMQFGYIIAICLSLPLFFIIPVETSNKPLDDIEIKWYKKKATFILVIDLLVVIISSIYGYHYIGFIVTMSITYEFISALAGKIFKSKELM
jgi:accessory gene regulator B